jgi:hypothetical protein
MRFVMLSFADELHSRHQRRTVHRFNSIANVFDLCPVRLPRHQELKSCWPLLGDKMRQREFHRIAFQHVDALKDALEPKLRARAVIQALIMTDRHTQLLFYLSKHALRHMLLGASASNHSNAGANANASDAALLGAHHVERGGADLAAFTRELVDECARSDGGSGIAHGYGGGATHAVDESARLAFLARALRLRTVEVKEAALSDALHLAQLQAVWQQHADRLTEQYRAQFRCATVGWAVYQQYFTAFFSNSAGGIVFSPSSKKFRTLV